MGSFPPSLILPKRVHKLYRFEIEKVRASAAFNAAARLHSSANRSIVLNGLEPSFGKYIGDIGNLLIESASLQFHLMQTHQNIGAGATLGKLQLVGFVHGFASPRRVSMYVKRMVQVGRLSYGLDSADKRVRRLIPGEAIIETAKGYLVDVLRAADLIWPGHDLAGRVLEDRDLFFRVYLEIGNAYIGGADPLRPFSDVRHFTSKDGGTFLMYTLISGCLEGHEKLSPKSECSINYSEMARHCGGTRTHVRNVVEAAAARGLLVLTDDRAVRLTPKMITSYERYFACLLILGQTAALKVLKSSRPQH